MSMRGGKRFLRLALALALLVAVTAPLGGTRAALGAENLLVCKACDKSFYDIAVRVVDEMNLTHSVTVRRSSCLGACSQPPVVEFRGKVYASMTPEKLRSILREAYP